MERPSGHEFDESQLRETARQIVTNVERNSHYPHLPKKVDAVIVLGGPGSHFDRLKGNEPEWAAWMDHDRIEKLAEFWQEVKAQNGKPYPFFVYNGSLAECQSFRTALAMGNIGVDKQSVLIQSTVYTYNQYTQKGYYSFHKNTQDNLETIVQSLAAPQPFGHESSLYGKTEIVLASTVGHFNRIPFYLQSLIEKYNLPGVKFYPLGVQERPEAKKIFRQSEEDKLVKYARCGDLATTPAKLTYFWEES